MTFLSQGNDRTTLLDTLPGVDEVTIPDTVPEVLVLGLFPESRLPFLLFPVVDWFLTGRFLVLSSYTDESDRLLVLSLSVRNVDDHVRGGK